MLNYIEIVFKGYSQLQAEANSIAWSYQSLIAKAKFIKARRIDIHIINSNEQYFQIDGPADQKVDIEIAYDVNSYLQKEWESRRKILYEIIFYSMDALGKENGWDLQHLETIKKDIIDREYTIYIAYSKAIKLQNTKGQLYLSYDVGYIDFRLNIYGKQPLPLKTISIFKSFPILYFVKSYLAEVMWLNDKTFRVADQNKEIFMDIDIEDESVVINYEPKHNTLEALQKHILAIKHDTPEHLRKQYMQA